MSLTSAKTVAGGRAINAERVRVLIVRSLADRRGRLNPGAYNARMAEPDTAPRAIAENRRARHDYFIEERLEAGLALEGWEVKAMRAGRAQLAEAYVYVRNSEAFLIGAHIAPLNTVSTHKVADPVRTRKLLLNRRELDHLIGAVERRGYTLVPLELYWVRGRAKLQVGLAKGKQKHDKRAAAKDRDWERDRARLLRRG
jgi:SsrA-binding protein